MGQEIFTAAIEGKTQANGVQIIDTSDSYTSITTTGQGAKTNYIAMSNWQLQFVPSAIPAAGSVTVAVRSPGASTFAVLPTAVDLVNGPLLVDFQSVAEAIKITPVGFDAAKTYSVYLTARR